MCVRVYERKRKTVCAGFGAPLSHCQSAQAWRHGSRGSHKDATVRTGELNTNSYHCYSAYEDCSVNLHSYCGWRIYTCHYVVSLLYTFVITFSLTNGPFSYQTF